MKKKTFYPFKIALTLCIGAFLLFNCDNETFMEHLEQEGHKTVSNISLHQFRQQVSKSKKLSHFEQYFDSNRSMHSEIERLEAANIPTILTDEIVLIDKDAYKTYTFKIAPGIETSTLYNLVLYTDASNQLYDSYIIEYEPSEEYIAGVSPYFSGTVKVSDNELFDTDALMVAQSRQCVVDVHTSWECSFGNQHGPGECNGTSFQMVFTLIWGECSVETNVVNPLGGGGGSGGGVHTGGGSGSSGNNSGGNGPGEGIVTTLVDPRCTRGKIMDTATGTCICPTGKVEDTDGNCVCQVGYTENINGAGTCVEKPCKGDPVKDPEIAPQYGPSGIQGAMFGNATSGGCKRFGGNHCSSTRNKKHDGIDIKNAIGNPVHIMYDGFIYSTGYSDDLGYYATIQSTINGSTILTTYAHMQKNNRVTHTPGTPLVHLKAGDIMGYQGDTGNIKGAIANKKVDPHVHIEIKKHDGSNNWAPSNYYFVDPRSYFSTIIDNQGVSQFNTNCN